MSLLNVAVSISFALMLVSLPAIHAQDDVASESHLDFSVPIRKVATGRIKVSSALSPYGQPLVVAELPDIQLMPGPKRSVPLGEIKGTWIAVFCVVPKLSAADRDALKKMAATELGELAKKEHGKKNAHDIVELVRTRLFMNIPDIESEDYAYRIASAADIPVDDKDWLEVKAFVDALTKDLKTSDGKESTDIVKKKLLPDYFNTRAPAASTP